MSIGDFHSMSDLTFLTLSILIFQLKVKIKKIDCVVLHTVFLGHGGGWGYSAHSVEAIRFCADADILLGGLGLFGGRGEYTAKIKVSCYLSVSLVLTLSPLILDL